jgi:putative ABC transport system permease protein
VIQGMNSYVSDNLAGAIVGQNAFQVRRTPIQVGLFDDEMMRKVQKRPRITRSDAQAVIDAIPQAVAISLQSGFPPPAADVRWSQRTLGSVAIIGATPPYQIVQDYKIASGRGLTDTDVNQRQPVAVIGADVADKLFESVDPVGKPIRVLTATYTVVGVVEKKGRVLGQSFDGFVLLPITTFESLFGRRRTTTISVKMATADDVAGGMALADEAMRTAHRLKPGEESDYSIETADALIDFWKNLTRVLFSVIPAIVGIGIVVGGIVIMNIMLMVVSERTREIGLRKALGAKRRDIMSQVLTESITLSLTGGVIGIAIGALFAQGLSAVTPLPAALELWSVALGVVITALVGLFFGWYPARRAAMLDPIEALRRE